MSALLRRFLAYLRLGVVEGEAEGEGTETIGTGDDTLDDLLDEVEPTPKAKAPEGDDKDDDASKYRREAKEARDELERERTARRAAEDRASAASPRATVDADYENEERQLAAAKAKGEDTSMLEWTIKNNRIIRESSRTSQAALTQAQDLSDKTAFDNLQLSKPKTYKRYADRVEKVMSDMRGRGERPPPRLAILRFLIGDDAMNDKLKPKAAKAPAASESQGRQVDRGRTPGARTDVIHKGGLSEADKRKERLRNTFI